LKKSNIENFVTLKHIVFGYKIFDKDYFDFNYFLTILGFSIYKAYYVSITDEYQTLIKYTYTYAPTSTHIHPCIYTHTYACIHIHIHTCMENCY
jgi:hypothetical protein